MIKQTIYGLNNKNETYMDKTLALPKLAGFNHIIDDGDCQDHGYFLPKQQAGTFRSVCNCGVKVVDIANQALLDVLGGVSAAQQSQLLWLIYS